MRHPDLWPEETAGDDQHAAVWELLPWSVSGGLTVSEQRRVDQHVARCAACRAELDPERRCRDAVRADAFAPGSPEPGLRRLLAQINQIEHARSAHEAPRRNRFEEWRSAIAAWLDGFLPHPAMAGAAMVAVLLGTFVILGPSNIYASSAYHVLTSARSTGGDADDVHVVFAPGLTEAQRAAALEPVDAHIVAGPNSAGAYTARIAGPRSARELASALGELRAQKGVLLAEAVRPLSMPHVGPHMGPHSSDEPSP